MKIELSKGDIARISACIECVLEMFGNASVREKEELIRLQDRLETELFDEYGEEENEKLL